MSNQIKHLIANDKPISLQLLNEHIDDISKNFPECYFPVYAGSPQFVTCRLVDATPGSHQNVTFLIATKQGYILNHDFYPICQLPEEGYIGRYTSSDKIDPRILGENFRFSVSRSTFNDVSQAIVCDYWVNIQSIKVLQANFTTEPIYLFEPLDLSQLPPHLIETITAKDFYETYYLTSDSDF